MSIPEPVQLPLPVPFLGTVNVWLLQGEPLTLVDTGPVREDSLAALEAGLAARGHALEDLELVLLTHHHLDHTGLAATIRRRSGARVAALAATAHWGSGYHARAAEERAFTEDLLAAHGVPARLVAATEPFWQHIVRESADYQTDVVLDDGDEIVAGDRRLRLVHRPGHSTTDTLYVDDEHAAAFVGDHLLARITSNTEATPVALPGGSRRHALVAYLAGLRLTEAMPLCRCYPGHGPIIDDHRALLRERFAFHAERLGRIEAHVRSGAETAFAIAERLWTSEVAATQTVLAIWEVVGHLDVLVDRGVVSETVDGDGRHLFRPAEAIEIAAVAR
jgi:glyoxylase-like metal-dependent hydrolase (beta-lactamase superfamily II)